jgi:hypothetical protein
MACSVEQEQAPNRSGRMIPQEMSILIFDIIASTSNYGSEAVFALAAKKIIKKKF